MRETMGVDPRIGDMEIVRRSVQLKLGSSRVLRIKFVEVLPTCLFGVQGRDVWNTI